MNLFWTKKLKQREGTLPPLCRVSTVSPLWPLAWLFIINGSGLWGNAKSYCSLPGCSRRGWEGEGSFPLCLWEKVRRKGGSSNQPRRIGKDFPVHEKYITSQCSWGITVIHLPCHWTTPLLCSEEPHTHTQPIRIHWRFRAFSKPQSGKMHLKNTKSRKLHACITTTYCTVILLNESRWEERPWDWNARMADGILLHGIFKTTPTDWKCWHGFSQWLVLGINNAVLLQSHIIPLLGCPS